MLRMKQSAEQSDCDLEILDHYRNMLFSLHVASDSRLIFACCSKMIALSTLGEVRVHVGNLRYPAMRMGTVVALEDWNREVLHLPVHSRCLLA